LWCGGGAVLVVRGVGAIGVPGVLVAGVGVLLVVSCIDNCVSEPVLRIVRIPACAMQLPGWQAGVFVGQGAAFRQNVFNGLRVFDNAIIVAIVDLLEYCWRKYTIECCKTKCIFTESIKSLFSFKTL